MTYDVAIIGAGVSGLGVAYSLKDSGLSVVMIDPEGFANKTSANSLRIIHGGLRYFQSLDFPRVIESIKAQSEIASLFPQDIRLLDCYMPLKTIGLRSIIPMFFVGKVYQTLYNLLSKKTISTDIVAEKEISEKIVSKMNNKFFFKWNDYLLLDHENIITTILKSIPNLTFHKYSVEKVQERELRLSNGESITAKIIVDCSNSFTKLEDVYYWQAVNIVVNKIFTEFSAVAVPTKERMLFFTPRNQQTAIGTFYFPEGVSKDEIIKICLDEINQAVDLKLTFDDIVSIDHGLLPNKFKDKLSLYGNNKIIDKGNFITVLNTKYTTFLTAGKKIKKLIELKLKN